MKKEFFLYAAVSALALAVDVTVLYIAAVRIDIPDFLAAGIAYAAGLVVHYLLSVRYVFAYRRLAAKRRAEAMVYAVTGGVGIALSAAIVHLGGLMGQTLVVSKLAAIGVSFLAVFLMRKLTLFSAPVTGSAP